MIHTAITSSSPPVRSSSPPFDVAANTERSHSNRRLVWLLATGALFSMLTVIACEPAPQNVYSHAGRDFELETVASEAGLRVTVTPIAPWSMNLEYPYASKATVAGVDVPGVAEDASEGRLVFSHTRHPAAVDRNSAVLSCLTRFAVCIDDLCKPVEHQFEITPR
jgi:hypothetical protein